MTPEPILLLAFLAATGAALMLGFPVAFTLAGSALIFAGIGALTGAESLIANLPSRIYGSAMVSETLLAIPLFVFMGVILERSRVAEDLLEAMAACLGGLRGGHAISVVLVGALLAASTGIVGATVVAMGMISLPSLLRHGVPTPLACGTICASGTLGQVIPPSIVLVILGDQMTAAYQSAQSTLQQRAWAEGSSDFTPGTVSVGDLFAGALLPGLVLVALYIAYLLIRGGGTAAPMASDWSGHRLVGALAPPLILILTVLGAILGGIAPPTEAAALGALGAVLLAGRRAVPADSATPLPAAAAALVGFTGGGIAGAAAFQGSPAFELAPLGTALAGAALLLWLNATGRLSRICGRLDPGGNLPIDLAGAAGLGLILLTAAFGPRSGIAAVLIGAALCLVLVWGTAVAFRRVWRDGILTEANRKTLDMTAMIFAILIGAALFSLVFRSLGGDTMIADWLGALPSGGAAVLAVLAAMFVLGFFLDVIEIVLIVVPIAAPILLLSPEIGPIWLGVMMALVLQTAFLTPPFGLALFYLRGAAPETVTTAALYRGIVPFVALQIAAIATVWALPALAEWLPARLFGQ